MNTQTSKVDDFLYLREENSELRARLDEAEETLRAIRSGEVDALVVGDQIYVLESAETASNRFRGEVLAQINDSVVAIDNDGRVTYLNPAAEKQYDLNASDVLGQKLEDCWEYKWPSPEDEAASITALAETGFWRGENIHIKRNGVEITVESIVNILRDANGEKTGLLAVIRDISDRKCAEEELQRAHEELESRVIERTRELAESNAALKKEVKERKTAERQKIELLQRLVSTQEDERKRISRDIHDHLGQQITGLRLALTSLHATVARDEDTGSAVSRIQELAAKLDAEASFLAWELRPPSLADLGLISALSAFVKDWSRHYNIEGEFFTSGLDDLSEDVEMNLYRITQEALNNVVKHSEATRAGVLLEGNSNWINLIIEDNGKGFDPKLIKRNHWPDHTGLGLVGIHERAGLIGADVDIESSKGGGTTIYVRIPVQSSGS